MKGKLWDIGGLKRFLQSIPENRIRTFDRGLEGCGGNGVSITDYFPSDNKQESITWRSSATLE